MRIVSLRPCRGHKVRIQLEDGRALLLDSETVARSGYNEGDELEESALSHLENDSADCRAYSYALYLLGIRDYSRGDLLRKLREKGYAEQAQQTVDRLLQAGLVNDMLYARRFARECRLVKRYGKHRIVQEMVLHGIDRYTAEEALKEVDESENITDLQQVLALLSKKRYNIESDEKERRRAVAYLQRKGYTFGAIREAFAALSLETEEEYG